MFSNRQKLAAVLSKWLQPALQQLASEKFMRLPFLANLEAKIKSTGWVSPMWSMGCEIAPLLGGVATQLVEPMLSQYLQGVPDSAIPSIAHQVVDNALNNGNLSLFEGNVVFERSDLEELKTLLRYNLPMNNDENYQVITKQEEDDTIITD